MFRPTNTFPPRHPVYLELLDVAAGGRVAVDRKQRKLPIAGPTSHGMDLLESLLIRGLPRCVVNTAQKWSHVHQIIIRRKSCLVMVFDVELYDAQISRNAAFCQRLWHGAMQKSEPTEVAEFYGDQLP